MSRRDFIKDIYSAGNSGKLAAANSEKAAEVPSGRVLAGPVRSMGLVLDRMEDESRVLQEALAAGAAVIELDTDLIDASFVRDRFPEGDAEFEDFKNSIAERGQEVPILVRPHPVDHGRYQLAYGHRRTRACASLGKKVKAIVRAMSDMDLVVAQGIENSQRRDLSYIERALFAARLEEKGFERSVICNALATDKGELSKLISVAKSVPEKVIHAIGPAPKTGRRRWLALVDMLQNANALHAAEHAVQDPSFTAIDTDVRFLRLFAVAMNTSTTHEQKRRQATSWKSSNGKASATFTNNEKTFSMAFDQRAEPGFAEFVAAQLDDLYSSFLSQAKARD